MGKQRVDVNEMGDFCKGFFFWGTVVMAGCAASPSVFSVLEIPGANVNIFIQGAENVSEIEVVKSSNAPKVESDRRMTLYGSGSALYKKFYIEYSDKKIDINGKSIAIHADSVSNYVLTSDGKVVEGFLRSFE